MSKDMVGSFIIGYDFSKGEDVGVLIVGRKKPNDAVDIVNAFQGKDAVELYEKISGYRRILRKI